MHRVGAKEFAATAAALLIAGGVLAAFARRGATGAALASDVLFAQGSAFLAWGIVRTLVNLRMFTSFSWGVKSLKKLYRGRQETSAEMKDGYLKYRSSRPTHADAPLLLICAAVLLLASAAVAAFA